VFTVGGTVASFSGAGWFSRSSPHDAVRNPDGSPAPAQNADHAAADAKAPEAVPPATTPAGSILPFPAATAEQISYLSETDSNGDLDLSAFPRNAEPPADCKPLAAGVRRAIDAFVICSGDASEPWLQLYRPGATPPFKGRFEPASEAKWLTLFPGYESALVFSYQVGSGGFSTVTVLMQYGEGYRQLTNWTDTDIYYAGFAFADFTGDGWKELVFRSGGKYASEQIKFRIFEFDRGRLEFQEWPANDPRRSATSTKILNACNNAKNKAPRPALFGDPSFFDSICSDLYRVF
jgi:hypothetical protein